jgi:Tat protein translocase TatB subunit
MFGIGAPELILIAIIAIVFIGPKKLPEVARTFGRGYREFQSALEGVKKDFNEAGENVKKEVNASLADVKHEADLVVNKQIQHDDPNIPAEFKKDVSKPNSVH